MTEKELMEANLIKDEIRSLERFISTAEKVWTGKLIKRVSKFIFQSSAFGIFDEAEYFMSKDMKNKVLGVLRERLAELKTQLDRF